MDTGYLEEALKSHAIVVSQAVSALAEIEAMKAANVMAADLGHTIPYGPEAFKDVVGECGLDYNAVVGMFIR
ncbi:hypothetical protein [Tannerella forsythia]|uniref:Uncharacterized protein n=1 Tax=Tannerella forsythia TaxID=28112 RepID=A0A3P1Z270_TANFO|nr:hypothetical protein [Tannerella forsythia]RRD75233.1 hypothetical protein EII41_06895 [Tannerella forsythia]